MFEEPEKPKEKKPSKAQVEMSVEGADGAEGTEGEGYEEDKKMSRLLKFNTTIRRHPSQVLRWCRFLSVMRSIAYPNGEPLSPVTAQQAPVPACGCGCARGFELQILPTLLSFVGDDDLSIESLKDAREWSSVLVYTCNSNCNSNCNNNCNNSSAVEFVSVLPPL